MSNCKHYLERLEGCFSCRASGLSLQARLDFGWILSCGLNIPTVWIRVQFESVSTQFLFFKIYNTFGDCVLRDNLEPDMLNIYLSEIILFT